MAPFSRSHLAGWLAGLVLAGASAAFAQDQKQDAPAAGDPPPIVVIAKAAHSGPPKQCFPVTEIVIKGQHDLLVRDRILDLIRPLAVPCQGNDSVATLLKALNGLYADAGYVTTQGFLPPQDIAASRMLVSQVVPGRINEVRYAETREPYEWFMPRMVRRSSDLLDAAGVGDLAARAGRLYDALDDGLDRFVLLPPSIRLRMAQTIRPGDILNVDPLQDTIDSLNRVPSHKAEAELAPGKQPATSDVVIKNRIEDTFRVYAGYDTESVEGVDRLRFGTTVEKDNLLGINDMWSTTLRSGTSTNELSGSVQVPYGNATLRAAADWQETATDLSGLAELFVTTWNASAGVDWIVQRNKVSKTTLDLTLNHREQNRYINGVELQDQRVTFISGGVGYSRFFERGSVSGRLGGSAGLPILNAIHDPDGIGGETPKSQFWKLEGSLSASYVVPGIASLSSALSGQWTTDTLYSDDQITIGSRSSVRGFSNASFAADSGFFIRNEVAFANPAARFITSKFGFADWACASVEHLNPYIFLDGGVGRDNANDIDGYRLSTGLGLRYGGPRLSYDIGYAFRIDQDDATARDDADGETFLNLRLKLF